MASNLPQFHDHSRHWIAIVGIGAGGARVFEDFLSQIELNKFLVTEIGFVLFESQPRSEWGRGIAWGSNQSDLFLANMRLDKLGLPSWIEDEIKRRLGVEGDWDHSKLPDDVQFISRAVVGEFFHDNLNRLCTKARQLGVPVLEVGKRVTDLSRLGRYLVLHEEDKQHAVDHVVLAVGNVPKRLYPELEGRPGFFKNPWRWQDYEQEVRGKDVGILGLGPTAVDSMLLCDQNGAKHIYAASRNDRMQYPRPKNENHVLQTMSVSTLTSFIQQRRAAGKEFDYSALETMLSLEFDKAGACQGLEKAKDHLDLDHLRMLQYGSADAVDVQPWFSVMKALDDVTPLIWYNLSDQAKAAYQKELQNIHTNLSYGMAINQADRLIKLFRARRLTIGTLRKDQPVYTKDDKLAMNINGREVVVDVLVNCTGIGSEPEDIRSALVQRLIDLKIAQPLRPYGGFIVDFETGQTLEATTKLPTAKVYSLAGSFTRGTHLLTNCLGQLFASCKRTSSHILRQISDRQY